MNLKDQMMRKKKRKMSRNLICSTKVTKKIWISMKIGIVCFLKLKSLSQNLSKRRCLRPLRKRRKVNSMNLLKI